MLISLLLVEDHEIVRKGLRALFDDLEDIRVLAEASNGQEAINLVKELRPDVVLMDMNMPVMNGIEATKQIKQSSPNVKVLILSMHDHENYLIEMLQAGADGYLLKNNSRDELIFAIRKVMNKGLYIAPEFTLSMLEKYKSGGGFIQNPKVNVNLSPRETEVLKLIAEGLTNIEIANKLFTSRRTVETHRKKLLEKTGTTNTATLIKFVVQNGIIS